MNNVTAVTVERLEKTNEEADLNFFTVEKLSRMMMRKTDLLMQRTIYFGVWPDFSINHWNYREKVHAASFGGNVTTGKGYIVSDFFLWICVLNVCFFMGNIQLSRSIQIMLELYFFAMVTQSTNIYKNKAAAFVFYPFPNYIWQSQRLHSFWWYFFNSVISRHSVKYYFELIWIYTE